MHSDQQLNFEVKEGQISTEKYRYFTEEQRRTKTAQPLHKHYFQQYEKFIGEADTPPVESSLQALYQKDINDDKRELDGLLKLQNEDLKNKLRHLRSIVQELTIQLSIARQEAKQLKKQLKFCEIEREKKIRYLLEQLELVLQKNSLLDQQITNLSSEFKHSNSSSLNSTQSQLPKYQQNINNSNFIENRALLKYEHGNQDKQEKYHRQSEQFLSSIKKMHESINGCKINGLHQLWRWLKQVGQTYSWFKRWKIKVKQFLGSQSLNYKQALLLLDQCTHFH